MQTSFRCLLIDQGGTNMRVCYIIFGLRLEFVLSLGDVQVMQGVGERPYEDLLREALSALGITADDVDIVVMAGAGDFIALEMRLYLPHYLNGYIDVGRMLEVNGLAGKRFRMLNDLEGEAPCIATPGGRNYTVIRKPVSAGPANVPAEDAVMPYWHGFISPGTGVGVAGLKLAGSPAQHEDILYVHRSEMGNAELGTPSDEELWEIWPALRTALMGVGGHSAIRAEGLFGGKSLRTLHRTVTANDLEPAAIGQLIRAKDPQVERTVKYWAKAWGYYCQSTLLAFWPPKVLWLSGVLRKDRPLVDNDHFRGAFSNFRCNGKSFDQVEVRLLEGDHTVLWGCAWWARREAEAMSRA